MAYEFKGQTPSKVYKINNLVENTPENMTTEGGETLDPQSLA